MKDGRSTWQLIPRDDGSPPLDSTEPSSSGASTTSQLIRTILTRSLIASSLSEEGGILSISFSRDGNTLASAGNDGAIRLWDLTRPESDARLLISDELTLSADRIQREW